MIEPITIKRWQEAQAAELLATSYQRETSRRSARYVFDYLGIAEDQGGKTIIEVGCGPYPATSFVASVNAILVDLRKRVWVVDTYPVVNGDRHRRRNREGEKVA